MTSIQTAILRQISKNNFSPKPLFNDFSYRDSETLRTIFILFFMEKINVMGPTRRKVLLKKLSFTIYLQFFAQQEKNKWFVVFLNLGMKSP